MPTIRSLDPITDRAIVARLFTEAADYYQIERAADPGSEVTVGFFTDAPPGCDAARSFRIGLFHLGRLAGVAEMSFGFPGPGDAYLGLMIFAPWARGKGLGRALTRHLEGLARTRGSARIYLGVLERNPRGRVFWERMGYCPTGVRRVNNDHGLANLLHRLGKDL